MKETTEKFRKKRKFLLVLPLFVAVFGTFACWALGLGSGEAQQPTEQSGINTGLPEARLEDKPEDKMSLYNQARQDSMEKYRNSGLDPFGSSDSTVAENSGSDTLLGSGTFSATGGSGGFRHYADRNEQKVRDRLARLEDALSQQDEDMVPPEQPTSNYGRSENPDLQKLEQMMEQVNSPGEADTEVQGLSELMEKVLDVQYPERARQKLLEESRKNKGRVYSVAPKREKAHMKFMAPLGTKDRARLVDSGMVPVYEPLGQQPAFYSLNENTDAANEQTALPAVIHETQTLLSGSTVKMRITEDIIINGKQIPAGTFVFGNCSINGERLQVEIPGIRYGKHLLPVALKVYDLDGLSGIRVPGALGREAAKDGAGQVVSGMQFINMDPSLYSQAAGAGVEVAKGLFSKKTKLIRVTVKAGYPLLLMDEKSLQEMN